MNRGKVSFNRACTKIFIIVGSVLLMAGCSKSELEQEEIVSDAVEIKDDITEIESEKSESVNLDNWLGWYLYIESTDLKHYSITIEIYKDQEEYLANVKIDGINTEKTELTATVVGDEEKIELYYKDSETRNLYEDADKKLLGFRLDGDSLITDWGYIKPYSSEEGESGEVRFEKIDGEPEEVLEAQNDGAEMVENSNENSEEENDEATQVESTHEDLVNFLVSEGYNISTDMLYYNKADFDGDRITEIVVGFGTGSSEDAVYYENIFLLENKDGKYKLVDTLADVYSIYKLDIIKINGTNEPILYCGITNYTEMYGFALLKFGDEGFKSFVYAASPSGDGYDEIVDIDSDGVYDGFTEDIRDYYYFNYYLSKYFQFTGDGYEIVNCEINLDEYPTDSEAVVLEYIVLSYIKERESTEIEGMEERLSDLSNINISIDFEKLTYERITAYTMLQEGLDFETNESGNNATVVLILEDNGVKTFYCEFTLEKVNGLWKIVGFNS